MMNESRHTRYICLGASLAAIFAVYLPALRNYPVADSWVFLIPHTFGETLAYFHSSMIPSEWNTLWLRPAPMLLFWLEGIIHLGTSWGPHLVNILLHVANAALIWTLTGLLVNTEDSRTGLVAQCAACLIYGLHPLSVGAVAWIAARFDVLSLTFGLAGMILWLKLDTHGGWRNLAGMLFMLLLSLLSKEQGIVFMAALFVASSLRLRERRGIVMHRTVLASLMVSGAVYILYRLAVFGGIGGYLSARHGFSIFPPVYYAAAILWPFANLFPGWTFRWTVAAGIVLLGFAVWPLGKTKTPSTNTDRTRLLVPVLVLAFGLATTMPNPGLTFTRIMDHAESRFALMAVAGAAILAGIVLERLASARYRGLIIAAIVVWSATAAWRTDVQLQSWHAAGETARDIVTATRRLVPDPGSGSAMIFLDIPRENGQYAYIFGIGLEEALQLEYGRTDFRVIRYPTRDDLNRADPDRDYVFRWDEARGELEQLHAEQ